MITNKTHTPPLGGNPIRIGYRIEDNIPFLYDIDSGRPLSGIFEQSIDFNIRTALSATVKFYLHADDGAKQLCRAPKD